MRDAVIVEAVRTPVGRGKPGGALSAAHPVDRQCGSSQQAVHFAAQGVIAGSNATVLERLA